MTSIKRAYIRIYNKSNVDFERVTIKNSRYTETFTSIGSDKYKTGYFYPNYDEFDSVPEIEDTFLTIETDKGVKRILIPATYKGECLKIAIDTEFKIETL